MATLTSTKPAPREIGQILAKSLLLTEKLLKCDWLTGAVFRGNLKYLHVTITLTDIATKISQLCGINK